MVTFPRISKRWTSGLPYFFSGSSTTIVHDISFPRMAHPKLWLFFDCLFCNEMHLHSMFSIHCRTMPSNFLFYKLFVWAGRVIGHKQQKSILSTKADGRSNGRDLLVYEWQGKTRMPSQKTGVKRAWTTESMAWPVSWDPRPPPLQQGAAGPRHPRTTTPPAFSRNITSVSNRQPPLLLGSLLGLCLNGKSIGY